MRARVGKPCAGKLRTAMLKHLRLRLAAEAQARIDRAEGLATDRQKLMPSLDERR